MLLASACAPTVRLPAPDVALPSAYERPAVPAPAAGELGRLDRWWSGFGDPQLDRLIATAFMRSTTARLAYTRIAEARAARLQDRVATLPSGGLAANVTEQGVRRLGGNALGSDADFSSGANIYPSWELDVFGRLSAIHRRADLDFRTAASISPASASRSPPMSRPGCSRRAISRWSWATRATPRGSPATWRRRRSSAWRAD